MNKISFSFNPFTGKLDKVSVENINDGTAQGQMAFWDSTLGKWVNTETNELFWDDTNKYLGIGTDTPQELVHIKTGTSGGNASNTADELFIEGSTDTGLTISCPSDSIGTVAFGDEGGQLPGAVLYDHSENSMYLRVGGVSNTKITRGSLNLKAGSSGATADTGADELIIESDANGGLSILNPNINNGRICFGDTEDNDVGQILYEHSTDTMTFTAGGTPTLYINNDSVGVNLSTPIYDFQVNKTIAFGAQSIDFPEGSSRTTGNLIGIGGVSMLNITVQDGSGRSNFYWNSYYDTVDKEHKFIVGDEGAVNFEIGNGYFEIKISDDDGVSAGSPVTWESGYRIDNTGCYLKYGYETTGVYINRVEGEYTYAYMFNHVDNANQTNNLVMKKSRGTSDSPTIVTTGDDLGVLTFQGYDSNSYLSAVQLKAESASNFSDEVGSGRFSIRCRTTADQSIKEFVEFNGDSKLTTFNDDGEDIDLRIQGSTDANLFYVNAGLDSIGIGTNTPTARLHLPAGTATAGTAPLKLTAGTALTTPETGTIEFHNDRFYITNVSNRKAIDRTCCVVTETTSVTNTTTETTIYTGQIDANALKVGNILTFRASGILSNKSAADDITVRIYIGTDEVLSFNPTIGNVTNEHWHILGEMTVRTIGTTASVACHADADINGFSGETAEICTINTTIAENFTVTVEWDNAETDNIFSIYQGYTTWKN